MPASTSTEPVAISAPPPEVVEFLTALRVPEGVALNELMVAQTEAMLTLPWPAVGELRTRVPVWHGGVGLSADLALPPSGRDWPLLIYVHGGGWEAGSPGSHRRVACELASRGFAVVVPRYRLGPEHRHPAQIDDLDATIGWAARMLPELGVDTGGLVVAGDSAGAHLAAALSVRRRLAGREDIGAALLLTGIFDYHRGLQLRGPHGWDGDPGTQPLLPPAEFEALRGDPVVNPLLGARYMPPTFLGAGGADPFAPQSAAMYEALGAAGVPAELDRGDGLPHLWQLLPGLAESSAGLDRAAAFGHRWAGA
jgi:acetyl esterase/lipase